MTYYNLYTWFITILTVVAAYSAIHYILATHGLLKHWRWRTVQKGVGRIVAMMEQHNFNPTLVHGVGRGGCILAGLIAARQGNRPVIALNLKYEEDERGRPIPTFYDEIRPTKGLEHVLLVTSKAIHGASMRTVYQRLKMLGAGEIRQATLVCLSTCNEPIDFPAFVKDYIPILPWEGVGYKKGYTADLSRGVEQTK